MNRYNSLFSALFLLLTTPCFGTAEMIPFSLPWEDTSANITNLSATLPQPAGALGRVEVNEQGHFEIAGQQVRFFGVNIGASAAFPDPDQAETVAARLARFGLNVVRFHHLDNTWTSRSVIDYSSGNSYTMDAEQVDRLDHLVAALKENGVYSNLNLLCSRGFKAADGLHPDVESMDWKLSHVLAFFDEGARNLQKQYAIDLLTHLNPYTGLRYTEDPAIAFVEINNENGLLQQWHSGALDQLSPYYRSKLQQHWNRWLQQKYPDTATLLQQWGSIDEALGVHLLPGFLDEGWNLEQHEQAEVSMQKTANRITLQVEKTSSAGWHAQLNYPGLHCVKDQIYTLRFSARSSDARRITVTLMQAHDPWLYLGFSSQLASTAQWQEFEYVFIATDSDANARLNFGDLANQLGTVEIRDLSLQTGGRMGVLADGISLETANLPVVSTGGLELTETRKDWFRFILDREADYWGDMKAFIQRIGYEGIIWGTTIMNSTPHVQSVMDAIDSHAYWQHPVFPENEWDSEIWTVGNESMVNDSQGGTIPTLAWQRVRGMPHNVTEYQHCSPNAHVSEGPLFLAAYASLQDWDGLYLFHYGSTDADWDRGFFNGFFDLDQHPVNLINSAIASLVFRRFDIKPALQVLNIPFDAETNFELAFTRGGAWNVGDARHLALPASIPLMHRVQMDLQPALSQALPDGITLQDMVLPANEAGPIVSDTGEITWDHSIEAKSVFSINSDRFKAVCGYQNGRIWAWPGLHMQFYNAQNDWCTAAVLLLEGTSFQNLKQHGGRGIIATTGNTENSQMGWKSPERTSVGTQWGHAPVRVENLSGFVVFEVSPDRLQVWSLDVRGNRKTSLPITPHELGSRVNLGGESGSIWYEYEIAAQ